MNELVAEKIKGSFENVSLAGRTESIKRMQEKISAKLPEGYHLEGVYITEPHSKTRYTKPNYFTAMVVVKDEKDIKSNYCVIPFIDSEASVFCIDDGYPWEDGRELVENAISEAMENWKSPIFYSIKTK